jgi:hypothetical protein
LIPELDKGFLGIAGRKWKSVTIRPGITPLENLSAGIAQLGLNQGKQKLEDEVFLTESMRLSSEGLKNACLQKTSQKSDFNALLVIDNFEDLFQFREVSKNTGEWDETVKCFIQNITKCASYSAIPVYFLIVLRAEYMSRLFEYRHFYEIVSASQYNLPQFRKTEFAEVIKAILQSSKMTMHKDGVDYLYNELGKDLKNLTLLKYYLNEAVEITASNSKDEIEQRFAHCVNLLKPGGKFYLRANPGVTHKAGPYVDIFPWSFEVVNAFAEKYNLNLDTFKKEPTELGRLYFVYTRR